MIYKQDAFNLMLESHINYSVPYGYCTSASKQVKTKAITKYFKHLNRSDITMDHLRAVVEVTGMKYTEVLKIARKAAKREDV